MKSENIILEKVFKLYDMYPSYDQNYYPIAMLTTNKSLSGNQFICLAAYNDANNLATSNRLIVATGDTYISYITDYKYEIGTTAIEYSNFSSSSEMNKISFNNGTTSDCGYNKIIMNLVNKEDDKQLNINLYKSTTSEPDNFILYNTFSNTSLSSFVKDFKYLVNNCRPDPEFSTIAYYTFNRQELGSPITRINDRANDLHLNLKEDCLGDGTINTITGYSYSPCEGGYRFSGRQGCLSSSDSNYFDHSSWSGTSFNILNGMTYMFFVKPSSTADQCIFVSGSGTTYHGLSMYTGAWNFEWNTSESYLYIENKKFIADNIRHNNWNHVAIVIDNDFFANVHFYLNGKIKKSWDMTASAFKGIKTGARLVIGSNLEKTENLKGSVGLFRVYARPFTSAEVMQNYLGTIPNCQIVKSIKIS